MCNTVAEVAKSLHLLLEKEQEDAKQRVLEAEREAREEEQQQFPQEDETETEEEEEVIIVARVVKRNPKRVCRMVSRYFDCVGTPQRNRKMPHFKPY